VYAQDLYLILSCSSVACVSWDCHISLHDTVAM